MGKLPYQIIDADNHYYETEDCFSRHLSSADRESAIHLVPLPGGKGRAWMLGDRRLKFIPGNPADAVPGPGELAGFFAGKEPLVHRATIDAHEYPHLMFREPRLELLDAQGIEAAIMLPTVAVLAEDSFGDLVEPFCANLRSFNMWLEEDWGYGSDGRIFAVPALTLGDPVWAAEELQRVAALGARFVYLQTGPVGGRSPADPFFDPFWALVQETGVKPIFHIDDSGFTRIYAAPWGEDPNRSILEFSPLQHFLCNGERPITDTLAVLILHNLFGRFPGIEVMSIENGSRWVVPLLHSMDHAARVGGNGTWLGGRPSELPSETFRQHVYVAPYHEDDTQNLVDTIGVERVVFGSDYPHPEGLAEPITFLDGLAGMSEPDVRLIMRDNTAALLGLA